MPGTSTMSAQELQGRKELARRLLEPPLEELAAEALGVAEPRAAKAIPARGPHGPLELGWPDGLEPRPQARESAPDPDAPLPAADVLAITWTAEEADAMADVLTPGHRRRRWHPYRHRFIERYKPQTRSGAPSQLFGRLGLWLETRIGERSVICFKSELHLNQDGIETGEGTATLPVKDLFLQLIEETGAGHVLTVGTAGGVATEQDLGDVVVSRAAKFRCQSEFRNEPFNGRTYRSDWQVPRSRFTAARELMRGFAQELEEPGFGPPTKRYPFEGPLLEPSPPNRPDIKLDGDDFQEFHPILTADFYEFGTTANGLDHEGCALEMGDAVLGLACEELQDPPRWICVRSVSDPAINADLPTHEDIERNLQALWATWYYKAYGYWTSVNGAIATWAIVAGLDAD